MNPSDLLRAAGDRFSIVSVFPAALVVFDVFVLVQSGAFSGRPDIHALIVQSKHLGAGTILLLALSVFVLGLMLQPFQLAMVRLLEGYWGASRPATFIFNRVAAPRRRWFATQLQLSRLQIAEPKPVSGQRIDGYHEELREFRKRQRKKARADAVRLRYPRTVDRVLPTALGNALRSFEDTAGQRYGLETIPAFRRLYPLMSNSLSKSYADSRLQLDSAAGLCVAFFVITLVSIPPLAGDGWWQAMPAGTALLTWITYRGAIASALLMGRHVTTAFDLHRHDLIAAMRYAPAPDAALEYAFNTRLSRWLAGNDPDQRPAPQAMEDDYCHLPASADSTAAESKAANGTP
jgi:hypothetical protein